MASGHGSESTLESLIDELLDVRRDLDALDMTLFEGTGCAPQEYSELVWRERRVFREIARRGAGAVPSLMTLSAQRDEPRTTAVIASVIAQIGQASAAKG